jgi:uncharacterized protein with von Willebrand factor type A (vWA) domain
MTTDEQTIIFDLMRKNGFQVIDSETLAMGFQKNENNENVQVFLTKDYPFYIETRYANAELSSDLIAKQTQMMKNFDRAKKSVEMDIDPTIDHLKKEIKSKLKAN